MHSRMHCCGTLLTCWGALWEIALLCTSHRIWWDVHSWSVQMYNVHTTWHSVSNTIVYSAEVHFCDSPSSTAAGPEDGSRTRSHWLGAKMLQSGSRKCGPLCSQNRDKLHHCCIRTIITIILKAGWSGRPPLLKGQWVSRTPRVPLFSHLHHIPHYHIIISIFIINVTKSWARQGSEG